MNHALGWQDDAAGRSIVSGWPGFTVRRHTRLREDGTNYVGFLGLQLFYLAVGGAEIVGKLDEKWVYLTWRYLYPDAFGILYAAEPIARPFMGGCHVKTDFEPSGVATTPKSSLATGAFD